jgi:hypothetical protein
MTQPTTYKRLERTRHERASLLSCVGEPLKRISSGQSDHLGKAKSSSLAQTRCPGTTPKLVGSRPIM